MPSAPVATIGPAPAATREAFFDNARFVMLALVFVGHAIEPWLRSDRFWCAVYFAIYSFHMPVFVWLAGRFASAELTRPRAIRLVTRLLWPFVVFQLLYAVFHHFATRTGAIEIGFVRPYWILWFLASLLTWRLMTPLLAVLPGRTLLSVGLALAAGTTTAIGYDFSLSRTFVFLPFFMLGFQSRGSDLRWLSSVPTRAASVLVLLTLGWAAWHFAHQFDVRWLYGSIGYRPLGVPDAVRGMSLRLLGLGVALLAGATALAWVPRRRMPWTDLGSRTLAAFVLHGFLIKGAGALGWLGPAAQTSRMAQAVLVLGAIVLAALLCTRVVERGVGWLVTPPIERWLVTRR